MVSLASRVVDDAFATPPPPFIRPSTAQLDQEQAEDHRAALASNLAGLADDVGGDSTGAHYAAAQRLAAAAGGLAVKLTAHVSASINARKVSVGTAWTAFIYGIEMGKHICEFGASADAAVDAAIYARRIWPATLEDVRFVENDKGEPEAAIGCGPHADDELGVSCWLPSQAPLRWGLTAEQLREMWAREWERANASTAKAGPDAEPDDDATDAPAPALHPDFHEVDSTWADLSVVSQALPKAITPVLVRPGMAVQLCDQVSLTGVVLHVLPECCVVRGAKGDLCAITHGEVTLIGAVPDPAFLPK